MAQNTIPSPDPHELLPPLLACLPTAFASPKPPPALLPLLTPILRQRVQLLAGTGPDSWLPLLNWDRAIASRLPGVVETLQVEPHPVSGEIEIEDLEDGPQYRRLDQETLHCRIALEQYGLLPVYLWCMGERKEWLLSELRTMQDREDGAEWFDSMKEADGAVSSRQADRPGTMNISSTNGQTSNGIVAVATSGEEDDSAYWAAYDQTPDQTPMKRSPAPAQRPAAGVQASSTSELEYFARYMHEVQPALDPDDPSEEGIGAGESTLTGNALNMTVKKDHEPHIVDANLTTARSHRAAQGETSDHRGHIEHPRPSSASSNGSVERLEQQAARQVQAETGIKQHISTDIKSLFRLATSAGIDRAEFDRIVRTELDLLALMDLDE